jgi:hypothetical protein
MCHSLCVRETFHQNQNQKKWLGVVSGFSFNQATEYTTSQGVVVSVDHPTLEELSQ